MSPDAILVRKVFRSPPGHAHLARSSVIAAAFIVSIGGVAGAEPILHVGPGVGRDTTVGTIDVAASPARVYQALTAYAEWPSLFRDITDAGRPFGSRERSRFRVTSALLRQRWILQSDNVRDRLVRLWRVDPAHGARGRWEFALVPSDGGRRTLVRLAFELGHPGSVSTQEGRLRLIRERKVHSDLLDLARRFDPDSPRWRGPRDERGRANQRRRYAGAR